MDDPAAVPTDPTVELRLSRLEADSRQLQGEMRGMRDDLARFRETVLERFALSDKTTAAGFAAMEQATATWFAAAEQDTAAKFAAAAQDTAAKFAAARQDSDAKFAAARQDSDAKFAAARQDSDAKFASLGAELARVSGQVTQLPTTWQMMVGFISSLGVITALGFAIARLLGRG